MNDAWFCVARTPKSIRSQRSTLRSWIADLCIVVSCHLINTNLTSLCVFQLCWFSFRICVSNGWVSNGFPGSKNNVTSASLREWAAVITSPVTCSRPETTGEECFHNKWIRFKNPDLCVNPGAGRCSSRSGARTVSFVVADVQKCLWFGLTLSFTLWSSSVW